MDYLFHRMDYFAKLPISSILEGLVSGKRNLRERQESPEISYHEAEESSTPTICVCKY